MPKLIFFDLILIRGKNVKRVSFILLHLIYIHICMISTQGGTRNEFTNS